MKEEWLLNNEFRPWLRHPTYMSAMRHDRNKGWMGESTSKVSRKMFTIFVMAWHLQPSYWRASLQSKTYP
ncbi:hypothetical protein Pmani_006232 [Petrolisthes manimaculis]|uniref:Uncharacterized protein n=1 Tax=Petrolisthes manimaculis TaxID=1843537 RepID=A0AAE1QAR9_9EUCA|nr:hypothetical protein Pmani_006232 [Petrolisthes manimaculis]